MLSMPSLLSVGGPAGPGRPGAGGGESGTKTAHSGVGQGQGMLGFRGPSNGCKRHLARLRGEQNRGARGLRIEEFKDEAVGSFALHSNNATVRRQFGTGLHVRCPMPDAGIATTYLPLVGDGSTVIETRHPGRRATNNLTSTRRGRRRVASRGLSGRSRGGRRGRAGRRLVV